MFLVMTIPPLLDNAPAAIGGGKQGNTCPMFTATRVNLFGGDPGRAVPGGLRKPKFYKQSWNSFGIMISKETRGDVSI